MNFLKNPVKITVVSQFNTTARPVVASTAQNRTHRLCDSHITIPRDVVNETTPVELDSICDLNGLIDNPVLAKYLKVLSHAYYYYSKWINYNLTDEMKRSYIQETIDNINNKFGKGLIAPASLQLISKKETNQNVLKKVRKLNSKNSN